MSSHSDSTAHVDDRNDRNALPAQTTEDIAVENSQGESARPATPFELATPHGATSTSSRSASPWPSPSLDRATSDIESLDPSDDSANDTKHNDADARNEALAFAPVALAQYHSIAQQLADNNAFRLLRSPAPVRVWVYRALLSEARLWGNWDRRSRRESVSRRSEASREGAADGSWRGQRKNNMAEMAGNKDGRAEGILGESDAHTSLDARHGSQDSDMYEESIDSSDYDAPHARPYLTRLRLALATYTVHFRNPGYIRDETLRMLERDVVKKTLEDSRKRLELREELGLAWEFWDDLAGVLKAAIPSLEKRCFAQPDPAAPEYEGLSGPLIASYSPSLLRDLERLNQLVCITRNVLVHGERVQNLSAERLFDKDIFNLINVCVRVTARGYDGEAGTQDEDKWQGVINACECRSELSKSLLIFHRQEAAHLLSAVPQQPHR